MAKPTIKWQYPTEGHALCEKQIGNLGEVIGYMLKNWTGDELPAKVMKYATEGLIFTKKQISNMSEIVKYMYDNWAGGKPAVAIKWKFPTEAETTFSEPVIENLSEIVSAMYDSFESTIATEVEAEEGVPVVVDDPTKNAVVSGTTDQPVNVTAKNAKFNNLTAAPSYSANQNGITVSAEALGVEDGTYTGATKASSNLIIAKEVKTLDIEGTTFNGQTYNTVMTGQVTTEYLKRMTIKDCVFDEECKHVNVWFAGFDDNATLNIKNTTFRTCEQFLCISDFSGADHKLTVNLENVEITNYEKGTEESPDQYEGIILLDDRICTSEEDFLEKTPFKDVTINITNCTAGGVALTADTFKMGNGGVGQMLYVYCAKVKKVYSYAEHPEVFPKVVVNGVEVVPPEAPVSETPETPAGE